MGESGKGGGGHALRKTDVRTVREEHTNGVPGYRPLKSRNSETRKEIRRERHGKEEIEKPRLRGQKHHGRTQEKVELGWNEKKSLKKRLVYACDSAA